MSGQSVFIGLGVAGVATLLVIQRVLQRINRQLAIVLIAQELAHPPLKTAMERQGFDILGEVKR